MLQRPFTFIQYLECLPLKPVYIVFKDKAFLAISGLPNFIFEQFLTFRIFQISAQRQTNAKNY